jgi:hypothetical protein
MSGVEGCRIELAGDDQTCDDGEAGVVVAGVGAASVEGLLDGDAGSLGVHPFGLLDVDAPASDADARLVADERVTSSTCAVSTCATRAERMSSSRMSVPSCPRPGFATRAGSRAERKTRVGIVAHRHCACTMTLRPVGNLPPVIVVIERRAVFSDTCVAGSAYSSFLFVAVAQFESDQHGSAPVSRVMPFAC